jgi:hypothetical protein
VENPSAGHLQPAAHLLLVLQVLLLTRWALQLSRAHSQNAMPHHYLTASGG